MSKDQRDYKWLENHINAASTAVLSWPDWKAHSSTLDTGTSRKSAEQNSVTQPSDADRSEKR
jgi:hypothetical protein